MPETKNIRVREAKLRDKGLFRKLWKAFLEDIYKKGSFVLPTDANLDAFSNLFEAYIKKEYLGIVLFVGEEAVLLWGENGMTPFESAWGKQAYGWGTYVAPEARKKGISKQITEMGFQKMKALGFDCVVGSVMLDDEEGQKAAERFEKVSFTVCHFLNK